MLASTRSCSTLLRSARAIVAAPVNLPTSQPLRLLDRAMGPSHNVPLMQSRHKHETVFDNLFEKPIDKSKVYIDEVIKDLGERGITRKGDRVHVEEVYTLFQMEEKFAINENKLSREMHKLQRALHPDKFMRVDSTSRKASEELSALINEAYEILRHPYKRAFHLLRIRTGKTAEEIVESLDKVPINDDFLDRMMYFREKTDKGFGSPRDATKFAHKLQIELDELVLSLNRDFEIGHYEAALMKIAHLKFIANCHIAMAEKLGSFSNF